MFDFILGGTTGNSLSFLLMQLIATAVPFVAVISFRVAQSLVGPFVVALHLCLEPCWFILEGDGYAGTLLARLTVNGMLLGTCIL